MQNLGKSFGWWYKISDELHRAGWARIQDEYRKMTHITEVGGMGGDFITLSDIFKFGQTGVTPDGKVLGQLQPSGLRLLFSPRLEMAGFKQGGEIFRRGM